MPTAFEILHELWTRDVGTAGYDKRKWLQLEAAFLSLEKGTQQKPLRLRCIRCGQPQPMNGIRERCLSVQDTDFFNFCIYQEPVPRVEHLLPPWESLDDE